MLLIDSRKHCYKANLHTHTTNSDGKLSPEAVIELYAANGYEILALTDHWKVGPERREKGVLVLPGVEYDFTFPEQVLHVVGLFPDAEAAAPIQRGMDYREVLARINACGGAAIAAHPAWSLNTPKFLAELEGICAAEVFNSVSNVPWNAARADSTGVLDVTAASRDRLFPFVASDDSHFYTGEQCTSFTMLQAEEPTVPSVLSALRAGSFYAGQGPEFLEVELTDRELIVRTSPVKVCTFVSNTPWVTGRCRTGDGLTESVYAIQPKDRFVRCEIVDAQGRRAWTSPVAVNR